MKTNEIQALWERRDRLRIFAEIIEAAKGRKNKTRIMYQANLSFTQVNEYLSFLTKMGFIRVCNNNRKKLYETTAKGENYIESYMEMISILKPQELEVPMLVR
ncbi:MAG: winged helix-turn-helix domain-containing protein [Candidatus Bathyarchaeota archaeon]|nr:winged helix-turn-helix domain-containing protein [Candidatus Bathyarchaeum sp.]